MAYSKTSYNLSLGSILITSLLHWALFCLALDYFASFLVVTLSIQALA